MPSGLSRAAAATSRIAFIPAITQRASASTTDQASAGPAPDYRNPPKAVTNSTRSMPRRAAGIGQRRPWDTVSPDTRASAKAGAGPVVISDVLIAKTARSGHRERLSTNRLLDL
jgi:hypothetical protein